jgi:tetratricopeptide (TPR) repeat protein
LIVVVAASVLIVHRVVGRRTLRVAPALALAFGCLSARRNADCRDELTLWRATVAAQPGNLRGQNQLALALEAAGEYEGAIGPFQAALRINPENADVHYNLGTLYANLGRDAAATHELDEALRLSPGMADAQVNLGNILLRAQRPAEALIRFEAALRLNPDLVEAEMGVGNSCLQLDRLAEAMAAYHAALRLDPRHLTAFFNLGDASLRAGRYAEAIAAYDEALRLDPALAPARQNREIARRLAAHASSAPPPADRASAHD